MLTVRLYAFMALALTLSGCGVFTGRIDSIDANAVDVNSIENSEPEQAVPTSSDTGSVTSYSAFPGQNSLFDTEGDFDVAIIGRGFFMVEMNGEIALTRSGNLSRNGEGKLIVGPPENSLLLLPVCHVPADATDFSISADGRVSVLVDGVIQEVYQLQLYRVPNRHQLLEVRRNLYIETKESGAAEPGVPGSGGLGSIKHRVLEDGVQVELFPEYNRLNRRPRAGERRFPLSSTTNRLSTER